MGQEIEAKMKVDDHGAIRRRIKSHGGKRAAIELETNIFFDAPDSSLRKAGKGLRIRIAKNEKGQTRCTVTFKGPLKKTRLKTREEIEFTAGDPAAAEHLLENLGYKRTLAFQKRRETWKLAGCEVELDTLPHLGQFVEIEGPSYSKVIAVRKKLGLSDANLISTAYISLLAKYLADHKIREHLIRL
jgi:predicted adenylyl cyclase CyaB